MTVPDSNNTCTVQSWYRSYRGVSYDIVVYCTIYALFYFPHKKNTHTHTIMTRPIMTRRSNTRSTFLLIVAVVAGHVGSCSGVDHYNQVRSCSASDYDACGVCVLSYGFNSCDPANGSTITAQRHVSGTLNYQQPNTAITSTVTGLIGGQTYTVLLFAFQSDLGQSDEYVTSFEVAGTSMSPSTCNPTGGDYACTYFLCGSVTITVPAGQTSVTASYSVTGASHDCDCALDGGGVITECKGQGTLSLPAGSTRVYVSAGYKMVFTPAIQGGGH